MTFAPEDNTTDNNDTEPISAERFKNLITRINEEIRGLG
jgi:hypothetical protein